MRRALLSVAAIALLVLDAPTKAQPRAARANPGRTQKVGHG
jgi:hypothetical protein